MPPVLPGVDHVHVYVSNRAAARDWYAEVLGLTVVDKLLSWARDGGPLTLGNAGGSIHIALFEQPVRECRSTIAFSVGAMEFLAWQAHLSRVLGRALDAVDHELSWSLYFADPDGNPYEITTYDYDEVARSVRREGTESLAPPR